MHGQGGEQETLATSGASQQPGLLYFVTVQLIALIGWIIVQLAFFFSPAGRTIPLSVLLVVETVQWTATLAVMFLLFRHEYIRFVQVIRELEETKIRLKEAENREATRNILDAMLDTGEQT